MQVVRVFLRTLSEAFLPRVSWLPRYYAIAKSVKFNKNDLVLDVGCGKGLLTKKISLRCRRAIGLDISAKSLSLARQGSKKKVDFILGNLFYLPFADNTFDSIISLDTFQEASNDNVASFAFKEVSRVLKPGGKFIFSSAWIHGLTTPLFQEQKILKLITPQVMRRKYLPGNKSWLDADDETIKKDAHILTTYTLEKLKSESQQFFEIKRYSFFIKKFGSLATDISYGIKGLWGMRAIFLWLAVRLDYYFLGRGPGYALLAELIKKY